jgi:hypothetical protein
MIAYENYGDVNPIEHGGLFIRLDKEMSTPHYNIIEVNPIDDLEEGWMFSESYIDLSDVSTEQWAEALDEDRELINTDIERAVSYLISYFGHTTFSDGRQRVITDRKELKKELADYGIHFKDDGSVA